MRMFRNGLIGTDGRGVVIAVYARGSVGCRGWQEHQSADDRKVREGLETCSNGFFGLHTLRFEGKTGQLSIHLRAAATKLFVRPFCQAALFGTVL